MRCMASERRTKGSTENQRLNREHQVHAENIYRHEIASAYVRNIDVTTHKNIYKIQHISVIK